jgi:hypothetical protein
MRPRALILLSALLLALAATSPAFARERLVRALGPEQGLPTARLTDVAQDSRGLLWIGSEGGLLRYDGLEARPWGKETLPGKVSLLAAGPAGQLVAAGPGGRLFEVTPVGLRPVPGPEGKPLAGVSQAVFTEGNGGGTLWLLRDSTLLSRSPEGDWTERVGPFEGQRPYRLAPGAGGALLVMTGKGVWSVERDRSKRLLLEHPRIAHAAVRADGTLLAVDWAGTLLRAGQGSTEQLPLGLNGPRDMVLRGETLWVSFPKHLVAVRPQEGPEILDAGEGFAGGGRLLLDREGALWMATPRGLVRFPEPDTVILGEEDGLPSAHTRSVRRTWEGLWVSTYRGVGRLDHQGRPNPYLDGLPLPYVLGDLCRDGGDGLWMREEIRSGGETLRDVLLERRDARSLRYRFSGGPRFAMACAAGVDGRVWIAREQELLLTPEGGGRPPVVAYFPSDSGRPLRVLETSAGRVWVARHPTTLCWTEAAPLRGGEVASWICEDLPGAGEIHDLAQGPGGELWVATHSAGVLRSNGSGWETLMDPASLPSPTVLGLTPSPRGGVWVTGEGLLLRVEAGDSRWRVLERPSAWNGVAPGGTERILEEEDGTLWVTGATGLLRIPPGARDAARPAPTVLLARLDPPAGNPGGEETLVLPREASLEARFAALSFRDPALLRYRVRSGPDAPWAETSEPVFRLAGLAPGKHELEVAASLDGESWSEEPARLAFRVEGPWHGKGWARLLIAAALLAALALAYRLGRAGPRRVTRRPRL